MKICQPLVSTIIPVYNGERFLTDAVECVLSQNYASKEIIVVDDGSTDGTAKLARRYDADIRYFYQENKGPSAARNCGLTLARGDVIAFLDVDDLWPRQKLRNQVQYLDQHPEVAVLQGLIQKMAWVGPGGEGRDRFEAVGTPYYFINVGSAVYRKEVFATVGIFDETMWENEDTDWFFRAWELNIRKVVLGEVSLYYRIHDTNMILSQNLAYNGIPRLFKGHIERIRAGGKMNQKPFHRLADLSSYIGWNQDKTHIVASS